jgi:hypothetical protein
MSNAVTPQQIHQQAARIPGNSEATNIEQSRAIAEVQAMVLVAQRAPRDEARAMGAALQSCGQLDVAKRAFFSFSRGGGNVNGPSIHLATELARCWGNIDYGIMELARDDAKGHTEMLAFAWDLETNTKSRQTFIVPHARDTKGGKKPLTDMRDIYENNANNGARRLRECIFRVLPAYLRSAAEDECRKALERGEGDEPLPARIAKAISAMSKLGVSIERIEAQYGASAKWTPVELANLQIAYRSIRNNETSADEAFPRIGTQEVADQLRQLAGQQSTGAGSEEQGRTDEQHGDQHDGTDQGDAEDPAWAAVVDAHLKRIASAEFKPDVNMAINDFLISKSALPDDARAHVEAAEAAAITRFNSKEGN